MKKYRDFLNEDLGNSIFPEDKTLQKIRWVDYMYELTPIEQKSDGMFYKREDLFAPMGSNSINGSKCRQLLYLFEQRPKNSDTVIHATNLNSSPQTPMTAAMARHYKLRCIQVGGGTNYESMNKKELPLFATMLGAEYYLDCKCGYNVVIQKKVQDLMKHFSNSFTIERDITLDHRLPKNSSEDILNFHKVGAHQVKNIPDFIENLILPFGSANSATSVILGLYQNKDKFKNLKNIYLVNVGVDKRQYMKERLELMKVDYSIFNFIYLDTEQKYSKTFNGIKQDDITFHPRYEAKVQKFIRENHKELINPRTLFWIIGSYPSLETTARNLKMKIPEHINLLDTSFLDSKVLF